MAQGKWRSAVGAAAVAAALLLVQDGVRAQGRGGGGAAPPALAKAAAPIDLTGYWRAEITEDWRWRMVTPAKGDWESMANFSTPEALAIAQAWDPAKDTAAGEQCKSYGAPGLMRAPTRMHITWKDDNTLNVDFDYGKQTRVLHFGDWKAPAGPPTWQGDSVARWEAPGGGANVRPGSGAGNLLIKTTNLRAGYLRKNGIPYGAKATMSEYWDLIKESNGDQRILMLVEVNDPVYLRQPWIVPLHFKKEPDGAQWDPSDCSSTW